MDISIIVPVFNVEKYITRCLDSIFNQQFTGTFEVIAVDDGSSDNSLQLLKEIQKNEDRLKIMVHTENRKLSVARSTGMKAAIGDYIMHVDSDDWLLPGALECLYKKIKQTAADVIVFNYINENTEGKQTFVRKVRKEQILTDKVKVQSLFFGTCWNKIVKRSITNEMLYSQKDINNGEDKLYATEILIRADKISLITEFLYVYFENNESLTQTVTRAPFIISVTNITNELSNLLVFYKQKGISQYLYEQKLSYLIDFSIENYFYNDHEKLDIRPLIIGLEKCPNIKKTKLNLYTLSNNPLYFILQFCKGRIDFYKFLRFCRYFIKYSVRF